MLAAACKVAVPMATAEILLDLFLAEGEADGGGIGGGLTGTAAATACPLLSLRAASLPLRIRSMCSSSSVCSAVATACHFLPGAGERVVGLDRLGIGRNSVGPDSVPRETDFNVTLCLEGDRPARAGGFETPRSTSSCC